MVVDIGLNEVLWLAIALYLAFRWGRRYERGVLLAKADARFAELTGKPPPPS